MSHLLPTWRTAFPALKLAGPSSRAHARLEALMARADQLLAGIWVALHRDSIMLKPDRPNQKLIRNLLRFWSSSGRKAHFVGESSRQPSPPYYGRS